MSRNKNMNAQGFDIIFMQHTAVKPYDSIEAACQFLYKGYEISISTNGRYSGACLNEHRLTDPAGGITMVQGSVQDAIEEVDRQVVASTEQSKIELVKFETYWFKSLNSKNSEYVELLQVYNNGVCQVMGSWGNYSVMSNQLFKDEKVAALLTAE